MYIASKGKTCSTVIVMASQAKDKRVTSSFRLVQPDQETSKEEKGSVCERFCALTTQKRGRVVEHLNPRNDRR